MYFVFMVNIVYILIYKEWNIYNITGYILNIFMLMTEVKCVIS